MKSILIVVDMQNGFNRYDHMKKLADSVIKITNSNIFDCIIATRFINYEGSQYTKFLNWHRLIDQKDIDLISDIKYDKVVDKNVYTCVTPEFINMLKDINDKELPTHVFVCGADTDCCVLKIATDLFEQSIMPIVLTDYCLSNGGVESHKAGILAMNRLLGKKSLVSGEIIEKSDIENIIEQRQY